jgi:hypothetical protein
MNRRTRKVHLHISYEGERPVEALALAAHLVNQAMENLPEPLQQQLRAIRNNETPRLAAPQYSVPIPRLTHKNGANHA